MTAELTELDRAHQQMSAHPDDDAARLQFYERLGDAELFMLLESEGTVDKVTPQVFDLGTHAVVLVFDREERLTQFVGQEAPYVALSGRVVMSLLSQQSLGIGLNLDVAPSSFLLDALGVQWLAQTLDRNPDEVDQALREVAPPTGLPDSLVQALDKKLATGAGLARFAYLVSTVNDAGGPGYMLAFVEAIPGAEPALARAVSEVLAFSGLDAGQLDVGFFDHADPMTVRLEKVGLRFDLPMPEPVQPVGVAAPGMDPAKPPKLR